jgi:hypothetical protein
MALSESHPMPMLLLSWTAWEALRSRFLKVIIKRQGYTAREADQALRALKISSMQSAANAISGLSATNPAQWPGLSGQVWRKWEEVQVMRHRLAQGFDAWHPGIIRTAGAFVLTAVSNRDWLQQLQVKGMTGQYLTVGDLLARQFSVKIQSGEELPCLRSTLELKEPSKRESLPSPDTLQSMINKLQFQGGKAQTFPVQ